MADDSIVMVQSLENASDDHAVKFLHVLIDELCTIQDTDYQQAIFSQFDSILWSSDSERDLIKNEWTTILIHLSLDPRQSSNILNQIPDKSRKFLSEVLEVRRQDMKRALTTGTLLSGFLRTAGPSAKFLENFNWTTELVLASDKMSAINEPLLTLDLQLAEPQPRLQEASHPYQQSLVTGTARSCLTLELDRSSLNNLIEQLETGQKQLYSGVG